MKVYSLFFLMLTAVLLGGTAMAQKVSRNIGYGAATSTPKSNSATGVTPGRVQPGTSTVATAQARLIDPSNAAAGDKSVVMGHFEADNNRTVADGRVVEEHVNVNYSISPAPFSSELNLMLNTADALVFSAQITNAQGDVVMNWKASEKNYTHNAKLDISGLPAGDYKVNVYWEKGTALLHSIPFTKGNSAK